MERSLAVDCRSIGLCLAVAAALGLTACGRNGALDPPPPSATVPPSGTFSAAPAGPVSPAASITPGSTENPVQSAESQQAAAQKSGFDSHGNPVAAPGQQKDFFLDFLLK
jgi:hypothetical protein